MDTQIITTKPDQIRIARYLCPPRQSGAGEGCGETDKIKLFPNESTPPMVGCWKCRAGHGLSIQGMMEQRRGMVLVNVVPREEDEQDPGRSWSTELGGKGHPLPS